MPVRIRPVEIDDCDEFVAAAKSSRPLHKGWVSPPLTCEAFANYVACFKPPASYGFVVVTKEDDRLAGAINITNIVQGVFQSGYLGYFAFAGSHGRGLMSQGLRAAVRFAFTKLHLHRLEANIQPDNTRSIALAQACGFRIEGYSPAYLKIGGHWRDHERWAVVRTG